MPTDVDHRGTVPHMAELSVHAARRAWAEAGFRPNRLQLEDEAGAPVAVAPTEEAHTFVRLQTPAALTKLDKIEGTGILVVLPPTTRRAGGR